MFGHFLVEAEKEGIKEIEVALLLEKKGQLLLLQTFYGPHKGVYELPLGFIKVTESLQQAIQRVILETVSLALKKVVRFLTYKESQSITGKKRTFYFIVEASDPEDIFLKEYQGFAWVEPKDALGYPIKEELREILGLYIKVKNLESV